MIPDDFPDPFQSLAGEAAKVVADSWTVAMIGVWNAGLWALRLVLRIVDALTTPDLSEHGPGAALYQTTFWLAGVLVLIMTLVQLGVAAVRRDAKSLATVAWGVGKFVVVWAGWIGYGTAVVAACGGLTRALMKGLLNVPSWSAWQPWKPFSVGDGVDGTVATVLGLMGLLLWLAAIGHLLVMLTRGGALMVLVATAPISAAGLVGEAGRSWFWKSFRWFHAAAFTPMVMVLVLGVGTQMTTGVANGLADTTQAGIGTALPGVVMILIGCFAPLALFKLLAFVEPGTSSGAALRQGLTAQGGLQGLLSGTGAEPGSGAAAGADGRGRSGGESAGEDATAGRFTQAQGGMLRQLGGEVGGAAAQGLGVMQRLGAAGASVGSDLANQMGVGHTSYHPDFSQLKSGSGSQRRTGGADASSTSGSADPSRQGGSGQTDGSTAPHPTDSPTGEESSGTGAPVSPASASGGAPSPSPSSLSGSGAGKNGPSPTAGAGPASGSGGGGVGAGAGTGGAEAAAAVPIIPV